ncbi:MAG: hypothetical protein AAFR04_15755 [Pseudomonadota bacterium]
MPETSTASATPSAHPVGLGEGPGAAVGTRIAPPITDTTKPLLCDMLRWIAERPRHYDDVMAGWRTSCPRLPVWEDAVDHGFVVRTRGADGQTLVHITPAGRAYLGETADSA